MNIIEVSNAWNDLSPVGKTRVKVLCDKITDMLDDNADIAEIVMNIIQFGNRK